ncbi:MAG: polysaccharide export protein [Proteobacteria bacterium]|nr:polysaccharide export protein [Pseudomonadota bacterium]
MRVSARAGSGSSVARLVTAIAAVVLLGACATSPPPQRTQVQTEYRVGPPDQLVVFILPEPAIERTVVVRPDGMISIDLVGDIPASGRTVAEIAGDIESRIARFKRDAKVTVSVGLARSALITVSGEVREPATLPLERDTRVAEAIGLVGGTTLFAAKRRLRVVRSEGNTVTVFKVNLSAIERGDLSTNILLKGGDIVVVNPTYIVQFGYILNQLLFPFQGAFGAAATGFSAATFF